MCWATFTALEGNYQREGHTTLDGSRWLCPDCFEEVRDHFELQQR
jgi:hypothetical protein